MQQPVLASHPRHATVGVEGCLLGFGLGHKGSSRLSAAFRRVGPGAELGTCSMIDPSAATSTSISLVSRTKSRH